MANTSTKAHLNTLGPGNYEAHLHEMRLGVGYDEVAERAIALGAARDRRGYEELDATSLENLANRAITAIAIARHNYSKGLNAGTMDPKDVPFHIRQDLPHS